MNKLKISTIFLIVVLIKTSWSKPIESSTSSVESADKDEPTASELFGISVISGYLALTVNTLEHSANISRKVLKDKDLLASVEPEVLEFKKNLTNFVEDFDKKQDSEDVIDVTDIFSAIAEHYLKLSDEEITPESKFIKELLKKYHAEDVENNFRKNYSEFLDTLAFLFDSAKNDLGRPLLDWYDKFKDIKDFEQQVEAITALIANL